MLKYTLEDFQGININNLLAFNKYIVEEILEGGKVFKTSLGLRKFKLEIEDLLLKQRDILLEELEEQEIEDTRINNIENPQPTTINLYSSIKVNKNEFQNLLDFKGNEYLATLSFIQELIQNTTTCPIVFSLDFHARELTLKVTLC